MVLEYSSTSTYSSTRVPGSTTCCRGLTPRLLTLLHMSVALVCICVCRFGTRVPNCHQSWGALSPFYLSMPLSVQRAIARSRSLPAVPADVQGHACRRQSRKKLRMPQPYRCSCLCTAWYVPVRTYPSTRVRTCCCNTGSPGTPTLPMLQRGGRAGGGVGPTRLGGRR